MFQRPGRHIVVNKFVVGNDVLKENDTCRWLEVLAINMGYRSFTEYCASSFDDGKAVFFTEGDGFPEEFQGSIVEIPVDAATMDFASPARRTKSGGDGHVRLKLV